MGPPWYMKAISVLRYRPKYRSPNLAKLELSKIWTPISNTEHQTNATVHICAVEQTKKQFLRPLPRMSIDRGKEFKANEPQFKAKENKIEHTNFSVL